MKVGVRKEEGLPNRNLENGNFSDSKYKLSLLSNGDNGDTSTKGFGLKGCGGQGPSGSRKRPDEGGPGTKSKESRQ